LYGRLLALADHIESRALHVGGESRDTAAAKLMQRFAQRPFSTWRTIELALAPAKSRLRAKRGGFMHEMDKLHDQIVCMFQSNDFTNDSPLNGEFLLGFHCQRDALKPPPKPTDSGTDTNESTPA
jgi:CRISPR-associated protein Csd1